MTSNREKLNQLMSQRDLLELEASALHADLTSPGPNNEPPAGIKDTLVDKEGFPRSDIDIYSVRQKRNRLAVINTDHREIMKKIEQLMPLVQLELARSTSSSQNINSENNSNEKKEDNDVPAVPMLSNEPIDEGVRSLSPIAIIDQILPSSPAYIAGLQDGDKLICFSSITSRSENPLAAIPAVVRENMGKAIQIVIQRQSTFMRIALVPKIWGGRGVLGCHLTPIAT